ncbi:MAG: hypothetical protein HY674_06665 [Chloroflexi bacterium]|nr:hypothetical protein [Chloroflexota bacterium]
MATTKQLAQLEIDSKNAIFRWFTPSAGVVLAVTGLAKLWSAVGNTKVLSMVDPILEIQFRHLMVGVGIVELAIGYVCLFTKKTKLATVLVAWLSTNFLVYRLGLWWMDWHRPCVCLGNLMDALHVSPRVAENVMKVLLAYLVVGSYGLLLYQWGKVRR